ncbi:hypothetical protein AB832_07045 [Flavobacteriaceae bacterium (ex Bugula neritina AB1)]|nr:hypothetical protein AB832_07045 [Flavobacteriaceae bacterium (ex Bugula neritina AB1)]
MFLEAYAKLAKNQGATTPGTDPKDSIQGMSLKRIRKVIDQLQDGSYKWTPSRRVHIPKRNGSFRPLTIPNWTDKLVQEVIRMILSAYYEPQFKDSSHGFRPGRSCHTALKQIKHKWTGTRWFIEGDIKACFDSIDVDKLVEILSQKIRDQRFLKLIRGMLKAGYMEGWKYHTTFSGTPQGGVASPILANIFLHELDCYIEDELLPQYDRGKERRQSRAYGRICEEKRKAYRKKDVESYRMYEQIQRSIPRGDLQDPNYRRLRYLRYADDFLLGFIGPKSEAEQIKNRIGDFLDTLKLSLSKEKTYLTHARNSSASFLGYEILTRWNNQKLAPCVHGKSGKGRSLNGTICLKIPRSVQTKWIGKYTQKGKPYAKGGYIQLSDYEIVHAFGAQLRGIVNYYALADNIGKALRKVRWACLESARKTLAAKHRIRQPGRSYRLYYQEGDGQKYWRHLQVKIERENKAPLISRCGETPLRTQKAISFNDQLPPKVMIGTRSELLERLLKGVCELCGDTTQLESHHIRAVKDLHDRWKGRKWKPSWVESMIARRRKSIVVCHSCHQKITHGRYDGARLK